MPITKHVTGTATDDQDLYAKLITFLTTDADLVTAGENWTEVWDHASGDEDGIVLEGPGLSGTDQVFVGMRLVRDIPGDTYDLELHGMTGFLSGAVDVTDHVNVMPTNAVVFLDSGSMTYWFMASGRHFIVVTKITTVFGCGYAGWFLPFGTPSEYPYPMFIGGSAGPYAGPGNTGSPESWRDAVAGHSLFPWPVIDTSGGGGGTYASSAYLLDPSGNWMTLTNVGTQMGGTVGPVYTRGSRYLLSGDTIGLFNPVEGHDRLMDCYGGDKMIFPMTLYETNSGSQTYGALDGVFKCQGIGVGAEDLITLAGTNHLVVQNAFRTGFSDYFCVELS